MTTDPVRLALLAASFAALLAAGGTAGCGSSSELAPLSAEARFTEGKRLYDEEDWLEAIAQFEIVKLQYPGSDLADDA